MDIEFFKMNEDGSSHTVTTYRIYDGCTRVLIMDDKVWGFDAADDQHEAEIISIEKDVVIMAC